MATTYDVRVWAVKTYERAGVRTATVVHFGQTA